MRRKKKKPQQIKQIIMNFKEEQQLRTTKIPKKQYRAFVFFCSSNFFPSLSWKNN